MVSFLNKTALSISSLAVLIMAIVGGLDVIGANIFNKPVPAAYEITELLMVLVVLPAISSLQARQMNIAVDIVTGSMNPRNQRLLGIFATVLGATFFGLVAWQGWVMAFDSVRVFEYSQGAYRIPVYPFKFAFAVGASLMVIQYAKDLLTGNAPSNKEIPLE